MIKVDLITGFLGAGKTTFLLKYAKYLMSQGLKIGILVYDHGAVNVDMPFLKELRGEQCELEANPAEQEQDGNPEQGIGGSGLDGSADFVEIDGT